MSIKELTIPGKLDSLFLLQSNCKKVVVNFRNFIAGDSADNFIFFISFDDWAFKHQYKITDSLKWLVAHTYPHEPHQVV